jgi:hypothetical protein
MYLTLWEYAVKAGQVEGRRARGRDRLLLDAGQARRARPRTPGTSRPNSGPSGSRGQAALRASRKPNTFGECAISEQAAEPFSRRPGDRANCSFSGATGTITGTSVTRNKEAITITYRS